MQLLAFPIFGTRSSHAAAGSTTHGCWDDVRAGYRASAMLPDQMPSTACLRFVRDRPGARDAAASMWRLRRNVVFGPTRHIGVSLRASPDAYTRECLIRARSWSTLRGELGAIGPSLASLEFSLYLARRKHFKPCVSMIDDAERITSSYCGRWLVVDRSMMWPITDGR